MHINIARRRGRPEPERHHAARDPPRGLRAPWALPWPHRPARSTRTWQRQAASCWTRPAHQPHGPARGTRRGREEAGIDPARPCRSLARHSRGAI